METLSWIEQLNGATIVPKGGKVFGEHHRGHAKVTNPDACQCDQQFSPSTSKLSPQSHAYFFPTKIAFNAIWFQGFDKRVGVSPYVHVINRYTLVRHTTKTFLVLPTWVNLCSSVQHIFNHYNNWLWFHIFYTAFCWFHNYLASNYAITRKLCSHMFPSTNLLQLNRSHSRDCWLFPVIITNNAMYSPF